MKEKLWIKLAWLLPKRLVYWATIRLVTNATSGEYSSQDFIRLNAVDALKRW